MLGMSLVDFSFADLIFRITTNIAAPPLRLPDEYTAFIGNPGSLSPDATYNALTVPAHAAPPHTEKVFWDNGVWRTRLASSGELGIDCFDSRSGGWHQAARMSPDFSSGELLTPEPGPEATSIRPLYHPQDRAVILGRVCHVGGIMMHSSSILVEGKVLIFAGMSGSGKTTLARLWRRHGAIILNDERSLIHMRPDSVRAGASPWHGEENQVHPGTGPLAGIFFLRQAPENRLHPLSLPESLPKMMTTAFIPVFIPSGPKITLDTCSAILQEIPAYELEFTPDARALDLCRTVL